MQDLTSLLFSALEQRHGLRIPTSDPQRLRQQLYKIRKTDPDFANLSFKIPPTNPSGELWIINKNGDS